MPAGRPTTYKPSYPEVAEKFLSTGAGIVELAARFSTTRETLGQWRRRHRQFDEAISRGLHKAEAEWYRRVEDEYIPAGNAINSRLVELVTRNKFGWNKQEVSHTVSGNPEAPIKTLIEVVFVDRTEDQA